MSSIGHSFILLQAVWKIVKEGKRIWPNTTMSSKGSVESELVPLISEYKFGHNNREIEHINLSIDPFSSNVNRFESTMTEI
jgi:hypothetical protein